MLEQQRKQQACWKRKSGHDLLGDNNSHFLQLYCSSAAGVNSVALWPCRMNTESALSISSSQKRGACTHVRVVCICVWGIHVCARVQRPEGDMKVPLSITVHPMF